jgi:hypothetical protein
LEPVIYRRQQIPAAGQAWSFVPGKGERNGNFHISNGADLPVIQRKFGTFAHLIGKYF